MRFHFGTWLQAMKRQAAIGPDTGRVKRAHAAVCARTGRV
jgi:hypothetical protein